MNPFRESHFSAGPDELECCGGPDRVTRVSRVTPGGSPHQVLDDLAAVLALGVLRLRRRAIDATRTGETGIVPSVGFSPQSGDPCLEDSAGTRPCEGTRVSANGPLGTVPQADHQATRAGVA